MVCLGVLLLICELGEPCWFSCPAGEVETLQMQVCGFWLASGKKCQMALGDSSLIWIQGCLMKVKGQVLLSFPSACEPIDYRIHGILLVKKTGVGSLSLLQGIFQTQGSNPGLCMQADSLAAEPQRGQRILGWVAWLFCS